MKKLILLFSFVIIISLVLSVSCVTKEVPVTETYYETEYRTESYVEVGEEHRVYLTPIMFWHSATYFCDFEWGQQLFGTYYLGYEITTGKHSSSQVTIQLGSDTSTWAIQVIDLTGVGQLPPPPPRDPHKEKIFYEKGVQKVITTPEFQEWLDNLNARTCGDPKCCLALIRSDQHAAQDIVVDVTGVDEFAIRLNTSSHPDYIIEKVQLTWCDEVTKERQVPYQVEKQRTVMQTKTVPFWEVFFGE